MILIKVDYEFIDGNHVFKSKDVMGFLISSPDPEKAFGDIEPCLDRLLKDNHNIKPTRTTRLQTVQDYIRSSFRNNDGTLVLETGYYAVEHEGKDAIQQ